MPGRQQPSKYDKRAAGTGKASDIRERVFKGITLQAPKYGKQQWCYLCDEHHDYHPS